VSAGRHDFYCDAFETLLNAALGRIQHAKRRFVATIVLMRRSLSTRSPLVHPRGKDLAKTKSDEAAPASSWC
jgi:hypothetical protein